MIDREGVRAERKARRTRTLDPTLDEGASTRSPGRDDAKKCEDANQSAYFTATARSVWPDPDSRAK